MKNRIIIIVFLLFSFIYVIHNTITTSYTSKSKYNTMQSNIASKIIRFHVVANSNSTYDQTIKLEIKDAIVNMMSPKLSNATDIKSARIIIANNLNKINLLSNNILKKHNISYKSHTILDTHSFPKKRYGDMILPAGNYESVCIRLGKSTGKNWWCVLYPSLCFVDSTHAILPKTSKDKLRHTLTLDEYNYIIQSPKTKITFTSLLSKLF